MRCWINEVALGIEETGDAHISTRRATIVDVCFRTELEVKEFLKILIVLDCRRR